MVVATAHLKLVLNLPKIPRVHFRLLFRYMAVCNDHISVGYHHQYQRHRRKYDKNSLQRLKIILPVSAEEMRFVHGFLIRAYRKLLRINEVF